MTDVALVIESSSFTGAVVVVSGTTYLGARVHSTSAVSVANLPSKVQIASMAVVGPVTATLGGKFIDGTTIASSSSVIISSARPVAAEVDSSSAVTVAAHSNGVLYQESTLVAGRSDVSATLAMGIHVQTGVVIRSSSLVKVAAPHSRQNVGATARGKSRVLPAVSVSHALSDVAVLVRSSSDVSWRFSPGSDPTGPTDPGGGDTGEPIGTSDLSNNLPCGMAIDLFGRFQIEHPELNSG